MIERKPIIAVIGAGAVGAYYGGRLAQHGHDVHFLLRGDYPTVRRLGWTIRSCDGDFALPPQTLNIYDDVRRMPPADLVIVTLKSTANDQYEPLIRPLLKDNTAILALQNGLGNEERLAELFGAERVFGGLAFVCINRLPEGVIHHISYGLVRVGAFLDKNIDSARLWVELLSRCRIKCNLLPSLAYGRWEKLVWNVPFSGLGAALDLHTQQLLASAEGEALVRAIMGEVVAAAAGVGVELPADIIDQNIEVTRPVGAYHSSMQLDRQARRPMEVEAILGEPLRAAQRAGVPTPHLLSLYRMVQAVNLGNIDSGS